MTGGSRVRRVVGGVGAVFALLVIVFGVPALLVRAVGNPWPGRDRIELGDISAIVVGLVAVLAWLVWARFTLAVLAEVPLQWRQVVEDRHRRSTAPADLAPPPRRPGGIGMIAARLVAAALVLLPVTMRPSPAVAAPALRAMTPATLVVDELPTGGPVTMRPSIGARTAPPAGASASALVRVADGDTLRGLARRHLGDAERWREIYELNRDRPQQGGARLLSPSTLASGWLVMLPADARVDGPANPPGAPTGPAAPSVPAATVTVEAGDTLWDLAHERLEGAGLAHDDPHVDDAVDAVVAANPDVVEDPDLIFPGEQIAFPAIGSAGPSVAPPPPPPAPAPVALPVPSAPPPAPVAPVADAVAPVSDLVAPVEIPARPTVPDTVAVPSSEPTTDSSAVPVPAPPAQISVERSASAPSPIGLGEAALLSTGVLALLAARRRRRLRAAEPRARIPETAPERVVVERQLRTVDARERLVRVDVAVRAAAASLVDSLAQPAVVRVGTDGAVELTLTADATLPSPWKPIHGRWVLPGSVPVELLADAARRVGAPCVALTQLGVDDDEREVLVDLEALGVLSIHGPDDVADAVVRGIAATLASSVFAEPANLVGVGLDDLVFLDHRLAHHVGGVEEALELATTLVGTTASARQSTFVLRARHTSGESWEPAVVVVGTGLAHEVTPDVVRTVGRRRGGLAMVVSGDTPPGPWSLRATDDTWTLEPLGLQLTPVGLTVEELAAVYDVLHEAEAPLVAEEPVVGSPIAVAGATAATDDADDGEAYRDPPWALLVRVLGTVDVVDTELVPVHFERSKTLELIAWLTLHRARSTRAGARSALWDLDVRDATFANVVSEARRALARHVPPPPGEEWLERTLTERLPLHDQVVSDADLMQARLEHARLQPPQQAIETLRPAVELIRDLPFAGTGYLWPDPEGIASGLVLLATSAATELAGHHLSMGDVDGVFWATGQGLKVLPAHEELIALRMRAHHRAGDLSGVRLEWESYERVLDADSWGDGEPAPKLVDLRRELLSPSTA